MRAYIFTLILVFTPFIFGAIWSMAHNQWIVGFGLLAVVLIMTFKEIKYVIKQSKFK